MWGHLKMGIRGVLGDMVETLQPQEPLEIPSSGPKNKTLGSSIPTVESGPQKLTLQTGIGRLQ